MGGIYWLASYPKSGNTWFRAFLQNLLEDGDEPVKINDLATGAIASARGWLDEVLGFDTAELTDDQVDRLRPEVYRWSVKSGEPEYHKIHDAYTWTSDGRPVVGRGATLGALYIIRNPLDVAPSYANHSNCTIDEAIETMGRAGAMSSRSRKRLRSQVRQKLLSWSGHVLSWVDAPGLKIEIVRYEDMLQDGPATFTRAARFLRLPESPERIEKAIRFSRFEALSKQEADEGFKERPHDTERFFRRGRSGGWRDTLNAEQVRRIVLQHGPVMRRFGYLDDAGNPR